jgi:hypothetical protein
MTLNLIAGWSAFLAGGVAGAIPGLFFHRERWLGGYGSWPRRMIRLAHISLFALGFLNVLFALTVHAHELAGGLAAASVLLVAGLAAMPAVCYLSAWKQAFRHVFFIPAGAILVGTGLVVWRLFAL